MTKTLILLLFSIILLGLGSCTKLESCDCGIEGKFVYFENGKKILCAEELEQLKLLFMQMIMSILLTAIYQKSLDYKKHPMLVYV